MGIDEAKLNDLLGRILNDAGGAITGALVILGDKLGLYKAMAGAGPLLPGELAKRTDCNERYLREWLCAMAASGYVEYDPETEQFTLPGEQAFLFANEDSPANVPGMFQVLGSVYLDEPKVAEAFKTGGGVGWNQHNACLFCGTERFFRGGYNAHLIGEWIPALDGVEAKLQAGATVADVGCGLGASTILMAQAYPNSRFFGYDSHSPSIEWARERAEAAGVSDQVTFEVATAKEYPGQNYDLVAFFDCLHDMGDPVGASRHVRETLKPDGTWLIVEPFAHDRVEDNLNPVGRLYYSASTMVCTPASKAQEVGLALGAQAGEARLRDVVTQGGFSRFRRATETPFNLILEAKP